MEKWVYTGRYIKVSEEEIEGHVWERAHIADSLIVLPIDEAGRILFIRERRPHESPPVRWKPVTGFFESDTDLAGNVNRELQEEIGKRADRVLSYVTLKSTGTLNHHLVVALAGGLHDSKLPNPDGEDVVEAVEAWSLEEMFQRTLEGEISRGAAGYALLRLYHEARAGKWAEFFPGRA